LPRNRQLLNNTVASVAISALQASEFLQERHLASAWSISASRASLVQRGGEAENIPLYGQRTEIQHEARSYALACCFALVRHNELPSYGTCSLVALSFLAST